MFLGGEEAGKRRTHRPRAYDGVSHVDLHIDRCREFGSEPRPRAALTCAVIPEDGAGLRRPAPSARTTLRQTLLMPPSTTMSEPVMNELSSEARKRAALASSSGCASLSMGV